ncbi:MAG: hypothetical protein HFH45_01245 [Bacilli bacterium]|nr:hypothetical protein [Bacilli bacterium]
MDKENILNITGNFISTELDFIEKCNKEKEDLQQRINDAIDYINFLVIFNQIINGKFNKTIWGEELLEILKGE